MAARAESAAPLAGAEGVEAHRAVDRLGVGVGEGRESELREAAKGGAWGETARGAAATEGGGGEEDEEECGDAEEEEEEGCHEGHYDGF